MDIVRSARKIVNINFFITEQEEKLAPIVQDMMRLFHLSAVMPTAASGTGHFSKETIFIKNRYAIADSAVLVTEIYYWRETGVLGCIMKRSSAVVRQNPKTVVHRMLRLHLFKALCRLTGRTPGPWGILRGVRPTKMVHNMLDQGDGTETILKKMKSLYAVTEEKSRLLTNIACLQRPFLPSHDMKKTVSIYVGIPYCPSRCLYCSFPAYVVPKARDELQLFLSAIEQDIKSVVKFITGHQLTVESVYIGGGTPTSLSADDFAWLLALVRQSFVSSETLEFTVEAGRPDSMTDEKIAIMAENGVSRVSINPQSMQERTLQLIGRGHSVQSVVDVFKKVKSVIPVVNMDIIAGLPGETVADMADTLWQIKRLEPDNLTVHTLALKHGSRLKEHLAEYTLPDEKTTVEMTRIAAEAASAMGMRPYYLYRQKYMTGNLENIGYAKSGMECRYNIQMMEERQTIIGIGPAAGTKAVDTATWRLKNCYNAKDVVTYIQNVDRYINKRLKVLNEIYAACKEENHVN